MKLAGVICLSAASVIAAATYIVKGSLFSLLVVAFNICVLGWLARRHLEQRP